MCQLLNFIDIYIMDYSEITFNKWKNLNTLFYSRGKHVLRMYQDGTIKLTNFQGRTFQYEIVGTQEEGNKIAFSIINRNSNKAGSLILTSNRKALLVFKGMNGYKFKI